MVFLFPEDILFFQATKDLQAQSIWIEDFEQVPSHQPFRMISILYQKKLFQLYFLNFTTESDYKN